jgi:hypothetical protein
MHLNPWHNTETPLCSMYVKGKHRVLEQPIARNQISSGSDDVQFSTLVEATSPATKVCSFVYFVHENELATTVKKTTNQPCKNYVYLSCFVQNVKLYSNSGRDDCILRLFVDDSVSAYWGKEWETILHWLKREFDFVQVTQVSVPSIRNIRIGIGHVGFSATTFRFFTLPNDTATLISFRDSDYVYDWTQTHEPDAELIRQNKLLSKVHVPDYAFPIDAGDW